MKAEGLVVDSHVWIAALISPRGTARQLVDAVLDLEIDIVLSESTFQELVPRACRDESSGCDHQR